MTPPDFVADGLCAVVMVGELLAVCMGCLGLVGLFPCVLDWLEAILGEGK